MDICFTPLPVFKCAGDKTAVPSRAAHEEREADFFPPVIRRVSPEIRRACTISELKACLLSLVDILVPSYSSAVIP